jgi:multicomponent Na+:H+ antiporter subunit E
MPVAIVARAVLARALLLAGLWWLLAGERADSWALGLVSIAAALGAGLVLMPPGPGRLSVRGLTAFLAFFVSQSLKAGVQVASLALRPAITLRPVVRRLRLRLPEGPGRVMLANAMSLLPGTLGAGLENGWLRVHVLDARLPVERELRAAESHIAAMLGLELNKK